MSNYKYLHYFYLIVLAFFLNGCHSNNAVNASDPYQPMNSQVYQETFRAPAYDEPKQIALLLPLSGKNAEAAKAIREGFLASYYESNQGAKPNIRVYDTAKEKDLQRIYDQAVEEGADFVVGPLAKEEVQQLGNLSHRSKTPILALNHSPELRAGPQFAQFTLAPEAEAEQIADKAWQKGYRSASIIVPDNAWGKRTANAFASRWQQYGGRVLHTVQTNSSYDQSGAVRQLLGIDESQKRANDIKNLLTENVGFQPRRRQDVDVIVMAAPPDQARQLKPMLDFYYAENIPVYATSSIYSGKVDPRRDRDLNGVIFLDMPWLLDSYQSATMKKLLSQNTAQSDQYNRLFAMGVDAHHLTQQFKRLQNGSSYTGVTGILSLNQNNVIQRKLVFAKFQDGTPVLMN